MKNIRSFNKAQSVYIQQSLNKDLKSLHQESELGLSSLRRSINGIKSKTDQFEIDTDSNTLRFYPSEGTYRGY